jgi:metal transporter CNNM
MTKIDDCYMLEINTVLSRELLTEIYTKGFSRIPIYEDNIQNIVGILMVKDLILFNPE